MEKFKLTQTEFTKTPLIKELEQNILGVQDKLMLGIEELYRDLERKKLEIIKDLLLERFNYKIDFEKELKKKFRRIVSETNENEQTVYFNDELGKCVRLVTFLINQKPFGSGLEKPFNIGLEMTYY